MSDKINILDHGYLELIESWGSDESIIEAARMSTNKGFKGWGPITCQACGGSGLQSKAALRLGPKYAHEAAPEELCLKCKGSKEQAADEKLLRYLWEHKHHTPFEMGGLIIEVQAPIFVFREWQRHRTQSFNELSARYTELPDLYYVPSTERMMQAKQGTKNKQGSEAGFGTSQANAYRSILEATYEEVRQRYELLLNEGVSREIARLIVPMAQYSRMRASANLRNWLAFLTLRMDPAAQYEIRMYANALADIIGNLFPRTYELFMEGNGATTS